MGRLTNEADFGLEDWAETLFFVPSDPNGAYNILDIAKYQGDPEFDAILKAIALRLAAYENTGLEPEAVQDTVSKLDLAVEELRGKCSTCAHYTDRHNIGPRRTCIHEYGDGIKKNPDFKDNWKWKGGSPESPIIHCRDCK